jgi:ubiquinone/menaquinone biosynthesis C-methylase UbiE
VTLSQGLADKCSFQVADALQQPFNDNSFDLVYSMESGEHMPIKQKFVSELARVCAPGGRILIVTWCHRDLDEVCILLYMYDKHTLLCMQTLQIRTCTGASGTVHYRTFGSR